jgi:hypothetical protein
MAPRARAPPRANLYGARIPAAPETERGTASVAKKLTNAATSSSLLRTHPPLRALALTRYAGEMVIVARLNVRAESVVAFRWAVRADTPGSVAAYSAFAVRRVARCPHWEQLPVFAQHTSRLKPAMAVPYQKATALRSGVAVETMAGCAGFANSGCVRSGRRRRSGRLSRFASARSELERTRRI